MRSRSRGQAIGLHANGCRRAGGERLAEWRIDADGRPDDLRELLAAEPTMPVPSEPADAREASPQAQAMPGPAVVPARRPAAPAGGEAHRLDGCAASAAEAAGRAAAEEPKLSRPETLRASLPPLFGAQRADAGRQPTPSRRQRPR